MGKVLDYFGDHLKSSCVGCTMAKDEIVILFDHITNIFLENPSKFLGAELQETKPCNFMEVFNQWAETFDHESVCIKCPHLKERIKCLVYKLLDKEIGLVNPLKRKFDDGLIDMLGSLKLVAIDVYDDRIRAYKNKIFKARKALYLKLAEVSDTEEFPFKKRKRDRKFLSATNSELRRNSPRLVNAKVTTSGKKRLLQTDKREHVRRRIPIGPTFQADVPNWTGQTLEEDTLEEDSRWLGTQIWPTKGRDRRTNSKIIGKGIQLSCKCHYPGSVKCVKYHVKKERHHLKSYLGLSFDDLGLTDMGEEVSKLWTQEEQMQFDDIVKENPLSEGRSFLGPALDHFRSKTRKDIVSYYYNVYLLRLMSVQTRQGKTIVDSTDDEAMISE